MELLHLIAAVAIGSAIVAVPSSAQVSDAASSGMIRWPGDILPPPLIVEGVLAPGPIVQDGARQLVLPVPNGPIPEGAVRSMEEGGGQVSLLAPWGGGWLVGTDNGEWGGSLYVTDGLEYTRLAQGNVIGGFTWRGTLYVLSGLRHLMLDSGEIWEVDLSVPRLARRIKLPAVPTAVVAMADGTLIFRTNGGDVALLRNGVVHQASEAPAAYRP